MSHYQDQYYAAPQQTDEYGNPVHQTAGGNGTGGYGTGHDATTGTGAMGYGTGVGATGYGAGAGTLGGHQQEHKEHKLHRSGSSSSSSSEDDGQGGRRKKGMKEKIKEKLPGGHKGETHTTATTTPGGVYHETTTGEHHEKKGIMDKIKEKLPGHHESGQP